MQGMWYDISRKRKIGHTPQKGTFWKRRKEEE
jgi:hypothetical protein